MFGGLSGCKIMHTPPNNPRTDSRILILKRCAQTVRFSEYRRPAVSGAVCRPQPDDTIDTALGRNLDLKIALQRITVARANYGISQGALLPQVDAVATAGLDRYGRYTMNGVGNFDTNLSDNVNGPSLIPNPTPDFFIGFRASWEVDIWGKLRNRRRAAYNRVLASVEGRNVVVTALTAEIARLYYTLLALDAEGEIIRENVTLQQQAVELVEVQKQAGPRDRTGGAAIPGATTQHTRFGGAGASADCRGRKSDQRTAGPVSAAHCAGYVDPGAATARVGTGGHSGPVGPSQTRHPAGRTRAGSGQRGRSRGTSGLLAFAEPHTLHRPECVPALGTA